VAASSAPGRDIFIIGGEQIYRMALDQGVVDKVMASEVIGRHEGDVYFPKLGPEWVGTTVETYDSFKVVEYVQHRNSKGDKSDSSKTAAWCRGV
jgi:dihydrofolate reductase